MDKTTATDHLANPTCASLFLEFSRNKLLEQYWPRLCSCVESLTDEQVWWRPNEASNSIGNLILHLDGNVRQLLVSSFNRSEDARDRPAEFSATVTGLYAVYQMVEHFGMHYGQILFITKLVRGESLGFYRELDKTGRPG
jgi:hypothetical protein